MKTTFLLVRHATCSHLDDTLLGRALDLPLDAIGLAQARALAERLRERAPLWVECSPRLRALQTAHAIAARCRFRCRIAPALDELDFGDWAGRRFADLARDRAWQRWNRARDVARTPAGDDIGSVQRRVRVHLAALARSHANATVVLVTHAEIIRSIVLDCLGWPVSEYPRVTIDPASVTRLSIEDGATHLDAVNERVPA